MERMESGREMTHKLKVKVNYLVTVLAYLSQRLKSPGPGHIGAEVRSQNGDFRPFRPQGVGAHSSTLGSVWTKLFGFRPHCGYDILTDGHRPQYISDL